MATSGTIKNHMKPAPAARFAVGDYVYGPLIFFDAGAVVAVDAPNRYGLRMVRSRAAGGMVIGIMEVWPSATRDEAEARHLALYGKPVAWRDDPPGCDWGDLAAAGG